jgi:endoglucanase Acf2
VIEVRSRRGRVAATVAGFVSLALVATGCSTEGSAESPGSASTTTSVLVDAETLPLLESVPRESLASVPMPRLADDLVPPTNRWFSGLVFGDEPQPVFPLPLSFRLGDSGFSFGVPTVTSAPGLIAGPMTDHVAVSTEATRALVTRYDEVSVTTTLLADDAALAEVTIARGSLLIGYRALADHDVSVEVPLEPVDGGVFSTTIGGAEYGLVAPEGELSDDGRILTLPEGASTTWVAVPAGSSLDDLVPFANPVTGVEVEYALEGSGDDASATTTLRYRTEGDAPTLVGTLPHQSTAVPVDGAECELGSFDTTYGAMTVCGTTAVAYAVPDTAPAETAAMSALDLSGLSDADRDELGETVALEAGTLPDLPADSYFGGKALARIATLLSLARELELTPVAEALHERLMTELRTWTQLDGCDERADRCFVYDPDLHGMVGKVPSFGSEEFNDHHFHYGSFIYAAAIAAEGDEALIAELRPMITLLAADIASSGGETFATWRAFDPYSGHSWASGFSPFGDGNNQESSSEAVASHAAVALWGAVAGDEALEEQARWMLALESHSARTYYTAVDTTEQPYADFDRGVVGIVWDGKRDYATWFSGEPAAILGIQLLPMRPGTSGSLAIDAERILSNIDEATASGPAPQFADYLLMYQALAGPEQASLALEAARALPYSSIDDGNSRSYLLAFIMVQR